MSLFRRYKNSGLESDSQPRLPDRRLGQATGSAAISGTLQTPESHQHIPSREEVEEGLRVATKGVQSFIEEALGKGVPEDQLPRLLSDAMNGGVIPKITEQVFQLRDGAKRYTVFSGIVSPHSLFVESRSSRDVATYRLVGVPDSGATYHGATGVIWPLHGGEEPSPEALQVMGAALAEVSPKSQLT